MSDFRQGGIVPAPAPDGPAKLDVPVPTRLGVGDELHYSDGRIYEVTENGLRHDEHLRHELHEYLGDWLERVR